MKNKTVTLILALLFVIGLSLLLYPTVSDAWNSLHQSRAIAGYAEAVAQIDGAQYDRLWADARAYNAALIGDEDRLTPTEADTARYNSLLDAADNGILGYIEIPAIGVSLPIYHGTADTVLQIAIGHIEGTSLPVGGPGTHCVVSGHRGLPSAKLFTDLDKLEIGDTFLLRVLDEVLTYEVDAIHIVEPHEVELLAIEPGQDLCTLVTCTPYGVNSHRLLVRGRRVENEESAPAVRITADAMQIDPVLVAPAVAAPMLGVLFLALLLRTRRRKPKKQKQPEKSGENPEERGPNE